MPLNIDEKLNKYWLQKRDNYMELLRENTSLYPMTENMAIEMACKEFVWWYANEMNSHIEKDNVMEWLFSEDGQKYISNFYKNKIIPGPVWKGDSASEKQVKYIGFLLSKLPQYSINVKVDKLTKYEASGIIGYLKDLMDGKNPKPNNISNKFLIKNRM